MTRPRIPLYGQILLWFFLNLALVAAVLFLMLRLVFGLDVGSLLSGRTVQQFTTAANGLSAELRVAPQSEWEEIIAAYEQAHGLQFGVYLPERAAALAGENRPVPAEILAKVKEKMPPRDPLPRGPGVGQRGPGPRLGPGEANGPPRGGRVLPPDGGPPRRVGSDPPGPGRGPDRDDREPPRGPADLSANAGPNREARVAYIGRDGHPPRYWAVAIVSLRNRDHRHPPDVLLAASSETLGGNAIFFDWRPWVWALVAVLIVSALIWLPFVGRVTRRLRNLTSAAESISEGEFDVEVASSRGDELGRLSRAVQRMASRLDAYMAGQKRFLGDIAHELCSPLARLRMAVGVLESKLPAGERAHLDSVNEEAEELSQLVNELLDFSRASMKPGILPRHEVSVLELLEEVAEREGQGATFKIEADPGLQVTTNRDLVRRALGNVVRNAVRYAGEAGPIELRGVALPPAGGDEAGGELAIRVEDCGPGIPEEWLEKVFEPFSRPERARTREGGGAGLGLAIARTCLESLGGRIRATNLTSGGLSVELLLCAKLNLGEQ